MAYGDFKHLARGAASLKALHDKAFNIAKNLKCDTYHQELASMVYNFFDRRSSATLARSETWEIKFAGSGVRSENMSDKHLAE